MFDPTATASPGARAWMSVADGFSPRRPAPERRVRSCTELKSWLLEPQTRKGEMIAYGRGLSLASSGCTEVLRDYVQTLSAKGFVSAHFMRDGPEGEGVYVVQRSGVPILTGQL